MLNTTDTFFHSMIPHLPSQYFLHRHADIDTICHSSKQGYLKYQYDFSVYL